MNESTLLTFLFRAIAVLEICQGKTSQIDEHRKELIEQIRDAAKGV